MSRRIKCIAQYHDDYAYQHNVEINLEIRCAECDEKIPFRRNDSKYMDLLVLPHTCKVDEIEVDGTEV